MGGGRIEAAVASVLGQRGSEVRWQQRAETLAEFVAEQPEEWATVEDVNRFLQSIGQVSARGLLPGSQAGAAVRAAEAWIKGESLRLDRERMAELEQEIRELRAQAARPAPRPQ